MEYIAMDMLIINSSIIVSWLLFSFLFWRALRHYALPEDRIFDLTFYATLVAFVVARAGFVVAHIEQFWGKSLLLMAALWVAPGLSWLAGLVGGLATLTLLSRQYRVRLGLVLDSLSIALPLPIVFTLTGAFLVSNVWVYGYEILAVVLISFITVWMTRISTKHKWPYGLVGVWFFILYAVFEFALEFFKEGRVYWGSLSANQWILIGIFAECMGVLYVRGGGRERLRPLLHNVYESISRKVTH